MKKYKAILTFNNSSQYHLERQFILLMVFNLFTLLISAQTSKFQQINSVLITNLINHSNNNFHNQKELTKQTLYKRVDIYNYLKRHLYCSFFAPGDTLYWVGDGLTNNWSDSDNWSDVSGGDGTLSLLVPALATNVFFDGVDVNANKSCKLDIAVQINGLQLRTGYNTTIDMNGNNFIMNGDGLNDYQSGFIQNTGVAAIFSITTTGTSNFRGTTFGINMLVNADIKLGGSVFNGNFTGTRTGSGSTYNTGMNTFNGDFEFTASQISGYFWMAGGDVFNGNIIVNSTANESLVFQGSTLSAGKTISAGSGGFSTGSLQFRNFTQNGTTTQSITLTDTSTAYFSNGSIFNGDLNINSPNLALHGLTVNGTAAFTTSKSGSGTGGNVFNGTCSISHNGSSAFRIGLGNSDIFNNTLTISNGGTDVIDIANSSTGNQFNGDIIINSTSGYGVKIGSSGGTSVLSSTSTIAIGASGFSSGNLTINGLTQAGSGPLSFSLTGSSGISLGGNSIFNGTFTSTSPNVHLNGATFNNTTNISKTNGTININSGGNTFNGSTTLTHSGP
jgi:hypothetical protein